MLRKTHGSLPLADVRIGVYAPKTPRFSAPVEQKLLLGSTAEGVAPAQMCYGTDLSDFRRS